MPFFASVAVCDCLSAGMKGVVETMVTCVLINVSCTCRRDESAERMDEDDVSECA